MEAGADGHSGASQGLRHGQLRQSQLQVSSSENIFQLFSETLFSNYELLCRSRPDSFISLESDIASEQENDKSEIVEIEVRGERCKV